jgi:hypothetical protein
MEMVIQAKMPGFSAALALERRVAIRPNRYSSLTWSHDFAIAEGKVRPAIGPIFDKCYAICRFIGGSNQDCNQACALIRDF